MSLSIKKNSWLIAIGAIVLSSPLVRPCHASINLPAPGGGLSQTFGNFEVYSLGFLQNFFGSGFDVPSPPGQIDNGVVILTGANGNPVNTNFPGMDDAFPTPNDNPDWFSTVNTPDPAGGPGAFDGATTWDTSVTALQSFLSSTSSDLVFFFNLNESPGGANALVGVDELAWAKVQLIDDNGVLPTKTYFLSAANDPLTNPDDELAAGLLASAGGGPDPNPATNPTGTTAGTLDAQWAYIHGVITVDANTEAFLHFGPATGAEGVPTQEINQNLGADHAAFAVFNSELNNLIKDPLTGYDRLAIDARLSRIDNGYEQAFIAVMANVGTNGVIPELTSVLTWVGLSTIGGVIAWRRRKS